MKACFVFLTAFVHIIFAQTSFSAEPIGRLFSTPEEREVLDRLRSEAKSQMEEPEAAPAVLPKYVTPKRRVVLPDPISLQGYVKRNDGKKGTVWLNGKAMQERTGDKEVQVGRLPHNSNRIPVRIPANGKRLTLKAGQTYDPATNKTRELRTSVPTNAGTIGHD